MESPETAIKTSSRIVLNLGKFRVISRTETHMQLALGGSTTMTIPLRPFMDVREGDLLTLYTEVLYAIPLSPPVQ